MNQTSNRNTAQSQLAARLESASSTTLDYNHEADKGESSAVLKTALTRGVEVEEKVSNCAVDLGVANVAVKKEIDTTPHMQAAKKALVDSERVEAEMHEAAKNLNAVNASIAHGINEMELVDITLAESKKALTDTQTALHEARASEKVALQRALHDKTTGLPTRELFDDRLEHAIAQADRHGWTLAVMFLDLNQFKKINDTHGHATGDIVLTEVAKRLASQSRDEDTVCRAGGDEFLFLLMNPGGRENIERVAIGVLSATALPIAVGEFEVVITASVGIAIYPGKGDNAEQLVKNSDAAMYRAKRGKSGYEFC